jgi:uncharacterized protein (DUF1697 family)
MTSYAALLRAVNVGGRKLIMSELKAIGEELGLGNPRTFIASGNLLFTSDKTEEVLRSALEDRIGAHMKAEVPVLIRTGAELSAVAAANPFADVPNNLVMAIFLQKPPPADAVETASGIADEKLALGRREIYAAYPSGSGRSKLRIPAAAGGTARNMNSVAKMAALLKEIA